jgi:hypothetical protein
MNLDGGHGIDTNGIVGISRKQGGAIGRPGQTGAGRDLSRFGFFRTERVDDNFGFQIPNLNGIVGRGTQPVAVGRKDQSIDNFSRIQTVQTLAFVQIPQHGGIVLSTRRREGAIGRDADGVQISSVSDQVVAEFAIGQVPDLDEAIPTARDNQWDGLGRRKADARDPFGVAFGISGDLVFAFSQSVPQTDRGIASS